MQLAALLSATVLVASVSADSQSRNAIQLNKDCNTSKPHARIINRCNYPVNIWSVFKGNGCPTNQMVTLNKGEVYKENFQDALDGVTGVSIKISKTAQCKGNDITQLEYFIKGADFVTTAADKQYNFNYLDVSYVDCENDCPTRQEGFYLKSGDQIGEFAANAGNTWCPVLSCNSKESCSKMAYVLPDDVQTRSCGTSQNLDFYMCGSHAPSDDDYKPSQPSSKAAPTPTKPASSAPPAYTPKPVVSSAKYKAEAAAVTNAPAVQHQKTKTVVVYATAYEYINAKRHAHGHARRHQHFHA